MEIEELLNERKDYMRETCPAYRLVCAEHEALVEILGSWPGISEAFRSYDAYRHMVALRYCAACYQKNNKLSDLSAEGMTRLVVTHELAFAREAAHRMVFMDHGVVVETGTPEAFFEAPSTDRGRQFLQRFSEGRAMAAG